MTPSGPRRRTAPAIELVAAVALLAAAVALLAAACGETEVSPPPSHDLAEPWQARPFAVDSSIVSAAEQLCRGMEFRMVPAGSPLVLVDARGANRLTLLFVAPSGTGQCFVTRDPAGRLTMDGGEGEGGSEPWPALGPTEITFNGAGSQEGTIDPNDASVSTSHLVGRAGAAIAVIEVIPPSGVSVQASLNRGWFAAWWLGLDHDHVVTVRGYDAAGRRVGSSP
jgi:hypothetical protein